MHQDLEHSLSTATKREREVILLIARGLQNKSIAHELQLSENTIRAHIQNIMRKYKVHNRTQVAVMFAGSIPHVDSLPLSPVVASRSPKLSDASS